MALFVGTNPTPDAIWVNLLAGVAFAFRLNSQRTNGIIASLEYSIANKSDLEDYDTMKVKNYTSNVRAEILLGLSSSLKEMEYFPKFAKIQEVFEKQFEISDVIAIQIIKHAHFLDEIEKEELFQKKHINQYYKLLKEYAKSLTKSRKFTPRLKAKFFLVPRPTEDYLGKIYDEIATRIYEIEILDGIESFCQIGPEFVKVPTSVSYDEILTLGVPENLTGCVKGTVP